MFATLESPASRSSKLCHDLAAISSGDSESSDGALCTSPVSMIVEEPAVISVHSTDSDPDLSEELCQFRPFSGPLSPVPSDVSLDVVESPSHYPAPAEPVVLYVVSSVQMISQPGPGGLFFCDT